MEKSKKMLAGCTAFFGFMIPSSSAETPPPYPYDREIAAVALGDSYAAGVGAGELDPATNNDQNKCRRSLNAPLALLEEHWPNMSVDNKACRGATIEGMFQSQFNEPPQLDVLSEKADLVTLSIGANMTNIDELFRYCLEQHCNDTDPRIRDVFDRLQSDEYQQQLRDVYRDILQRAPNAKLAITGYTLPIKRAPLCPDIIDQEVDKLVETFVGLLNTTIKQVVEQLASPRAFYVPPPDGVDACHTLGNGVVTSGEERGHPTKQTNKAIAQAIGKAVFAHQTYHRVSDLPPHKFLGGRR